MIQSYTPQLHHVIEIAAGHVGKHAIFNLEKTEITVNDQRRKIACIIALKLRSS